MLKMTTSVEEFYKNLLLFHNIINRSWLKCDRLQVHVLTYLIWVSSGFYISLSIWNILKTHNTVTRKLPQKQSTREKVEMGRALPNQGLVRDLNEITTCSAICRVIIEQWLERLFPPRVATADFPSPIVPVFCILLRHFNLSHVLFHHIHKPPVWPSPFPLSWQLHPQHPSPNLPIIFPP